MMIAMNRVLWLFAEPRDPRLQRGFQHVVGTAGTRLEFNEFKIAFSLQEASRVCGR